MDFIFIFVAALIIGVCYVSMFYSAKDRVRAEYALASRNASSNDLMNATAHWRRATVAVTLAAAGMGTGFLLLLAAVTNLVS